MAARHIRGPRTAAKRARLPKQLPPQLAVWAIWALIVAQVGQEILGQTLIVSFGFYTLHIVDPAVVLCFAAWGTAQWRRFPGGGAMAVPVTGIAVLVGINLLRGMATDTAAALLWARANLALGAVLMFAVTCPLSPAVRRAARAALLAGAAVLSILIALRLATRPSLFMTFTGVSDSQINDGGRPLAASGAYLIGLAAALLLSDVLRSDRRRAARMAGVAWLCMAELSTGQGTASIALLAMIAIVGLLERGWLRDLRAVVWLCGAVLAGGLMLLINVGQLPIAGAGLFDFAQRSNNLDTRQAVWAALLEGFGKRGPFDQLFGMPGGQLPMMVVYLSHQVSEWRLSIHSMYYGSLPVMGYAGFACYVSLLAMLGARLLAEILRSGDGRRVPAYPLAMVAGTAILSVSYEIRNAMLIGLFLAIWWYRVARATSPPRQRAGAASAASTPSANRVAMASIV